MSLISPYLVPETGLREADVKLHLFYIGLFVLTVIASNLCAFFLKNKIKGFLTLEGFDQ